MMPSVIIPVRDGMPYLPATVESLRRQTLADFEAIVVDDGSTDDSPAYLQALDDNRFSYLRVERMGIARALNFGIAQAHGELIVRIDADDIAYPTRLEEQVA